ncbi:MAG: MFS transporter [Deltaproteobacteria bacterium]|nr:MFS transporter [Deltaproteobacteria bacterium]
MSDAPARDPRALLAVVVFGAFLSSLTSSVINVALPDIARDFHVDPSQASWFVLSFLLAVTVLLLPAGRVSDLLGHGRMYLLGMTVFGVGSAACALAPTATWLIVARIVQGVASSLVMATSPALMTMALPPERRGFALGLMSTGTYVGLTIGPPIGGSLVAMLGWRSIFWASMLFSLIATLPGFKVLPLARSDRDKPRFDLLGSVLTAVGTLAFLLLSTRGLAWGWRSPATIGCALVSIVVLPVFVVVEMRHTAPTLDLRLFRSVVFSSATLSALLNYIALFIPLFTIPFALRDGQGMSPPQVGKVLSALAAGMTLFSWGSGWLSDRIGSRGLAAGGMVVLAAGAAGLSLSWPTSGVLAPAAWLFLCGAGTGVFISPNSSTLMGAAPRERQGIAGGVMALARNLGMSLGVALGSGLFAAAFAAGHKPGQWSAAADQSLRTALMLSAGAALLSGLVAFAGRPSGAGRSNPAR